MLRTTISSLYTFSVSHAHCSNYTYIPVIRRVNTTAPGKESRAICTGLFGYDIFTFAKGHGGLTLYGAIWKERCIVYYKTFFSVGHAESVYMRVCV